MHFGKFHFNLNSSKQALFLVGCLFGTYFFYSCDHLNNINDHGNLVPKTVMEDNLIPQIEINGVKLHAQAFGPEDATLVVCIHGGPGANFKYLMNCKTLADKGFRVVFYDQVGSGLSERLSKQTYLNHGTQAIENIYYNELKGVIDYYKTHSSQKVILLTHSWGSIMASGFVGKYPNDVDGLILAEPGGLNWADIKEYLEISKSQKLWSEALNDAAYLDQFVSGSEDQHNILDYKLSLLQTSNSNVGDVPSKLGTNALSYKSSRNGAVISLAMFEIGENQEPNFTIGLSGFQKKVLFFYSSNNKAYSDSWASRISSSFMNKELVKVSGVGHSGMYDQIDVWNGFTELKIINYINNL